MDSNERDWLKDAAARWERKKAEEEARRDADPQLIPEPRVDADTGPTAVDPPGPPPHAELPRGASFAPPASKEEQTAPGIEELARAAVAPKREEPSGAVRPVIVGPSSASQPPSRELLVPQPRPIDYVLKPLDVVLRPLGRLPVAARAGVAAAAAALLVLLVWLIVRSPPGPPSTKPTAGATAATAPATPTAPPPATKPAPAPAPAAPPAQAKAPAPVEPTTPPATASAEPAGSKHSHHHHHSSKKPPSKKTAHRSKSSSAH
jgi:hypothetical protein